MEFITKNFQETRKLAGKILKDLITEPRRVPCPVADSSSGAIRQGATSFTRGALVLALSGELGAGKTTFVQGLAKALGLKEKILSPTFVIMKHFNILTSEHFNKLYHLDCYRLEGIKDLAGLGLEEILKDKNNLVVIEWAERIRSVLPADAVWIKLEHRGEDRKKIKVLFPEQGA